MYDLLSSLHTPVYNVDNYITCQIKVFSDIHKSVKDKLHSTNTAVCKQQHKHASLVSLEVGDCQDQSPRKRDKIVSKICGAMPSDSALDQSINNWASLHAGPLSIRRTFPQDSSSFPSHEVCGRLLGLLHPGLSFAKTTCWAGLTSGNCVTCPYRLSYC